MDKFYHFTNMSLEINKQYQAKKNKPYFGDYEKLYEQYKPDNRESRLNSFFLVKKGHLHFAEQFGANKYIVETDSIIKCYLFWNAALQNYCQNEGLVAGFKKDYGYLIGKPNKLQSLIIKEIVQNYFNGIKPTKKDYEKYDVYKDSESNAIEYLSSSVKIIKKF